MSAADELRSEGKLEEAVPLAPLTTYKFGGPARYLVTVSSVEDVVRVAELAAEEGVPVLALGRGSNLVVSDAGFDGVVLRAGPGLNSWTAADDGRVEAGAAVPLPRLARETVREGLGGLAFFTGVPGSVGGAVRMNAGCHGSETKDRLVHAVVVELASGVVTERTPQQLGMRYRHSDLEDDEFVVQATFVADPVDPAEGEATIREITRWRKEHQPGGAHTAGSVFKNPPGDAAGRIIDSLGLKGLTIGGARVSERHANFFEASPEARAADVRALVEEVRRRVEEATGIDLEPEVRFAGRFDS